MASYSRTARASRHRASTSAARREAEERGKHIESCPRISPPGAGRRSGLAVHSSVAAFEAHRSGVASGPAESGDGKRDRRKLRRPAGVTVAGAEPIAAPGVGRRPSADWSIEEDTRPGCWSGKEAAAVIGGCGPADPNRYSGSAVAGALGAASVGGRPARHRSNWSRLHLLLLHPGRGEPPPQRLVERRRLWGGGWGGGGFGGGYPGGAAVGDYRAGGGHFSGGGASGAGDGHSPLLRHLASSSWLVRRRFPATTLAAIEAAIAAGEQRHERRSGSPWKERCTQRASCAASRRATARRRGQRAARWDHAQRGRLDLSAARGPRTSRSSPTAVSRGEARPRSGR